ncbi:hypothetical protein DM860_001089 [Cuscuta australis]|uniref:MHD domain-containing protein n=1 Tax=Cuscuta australis TaxID=267555 RepID=A0A328DWL5_9ASTE|nr:hypothetical protein DM860_001089 [Cuscuta australis]
MSCLALSLQPTNGPDVLLQTREWFPPSRALMALSAFRQTRLAFSKQAQSAAVLSSSDPTPSDALGDDPLAASSGQVIVGMESRYRVVYRLVNSIYVLAITTADENVKDRIVNNVFECITIVNQAVSVVVTACRGVDVTPEKLSKKYAEIYMALDIVLRGVSSIRLAAMLASMHGESIAKMVHSAANTENKIRGAETWGSLEAQSVEHRTGVESFFKTSFELPPETLQAGDEVAATLVITGTEKEEKDKVEESEEKDPFAASDRINKPESLVAEFKRDKDKGNSDISKALAGLEVSTLPPAAASQSTHIGVEGFEGDYGGIEFSTDGSTLREDFEGINVSWGGGLDASEYLGTKKVKKDEGLGGLEFLETSEPPKTEAAEESAAAKNLEDVLVNKMKGPELYISEIISAEFRESLLSRVGMMGTIYLMTMPPNPNGDKETEFSFKVDGTSGIKRLVMQNSLVSCLGNGIFHLKTAPSKEPIPIIKYSLLPRLTPLPLRVRLVQSLSGTLFSVMLQYAPFPDMPAPLTNVTFVLKLPVDPSLVKVSPKAVLNRSEKELKWLIEEIPPKGKPGRLRARFPVDASDESSIDELEVVGYVKFSAQGTRSLSGISLLPAIEGNRDFYEGYHKYAAGTYVCN